MRINDRREGVQSRLQADAAQQVVETRVGAALAKIEQQLAQAGLLIPRRVELVLRDELGKKMNSSGKNALDLHPYSPDWRPSEHPARQRSEFIIERR